MKIREILFEMGFARKKVVGEVRNLSRRIFEHAVKVLIMPDHQEVSHWKNELLAWTGYLAALRLRLKKNPPMGFKLAYNNLYKGPFEGNEIGMVAHLIRLAEVSYEVETDADPVVIHARLKMFLTEIARDVGAGVDPRPTIQKLNNGI